MGRSPRCLFESDIESFLTKDKANIHTSAIYRTSSGLELDYTCLLWDANMRYVDGAWKYYTWSRQKSEWVKLEANTESNKDRMQYMLNAYRVLLTRARAGMIICVPEGNAHKNVSGYWEDRTSGAYFN